MYKQMKYIGLVVFAVALAGCSSVTVTEEELNQRIDAELTAQPREFVLPLSLSQTGTQIASATARVESAEVSLLAADDTSVQADKGVAEISLRLSSEVAIAIFGQRLRFALDALPLVRAGLEVRDKALYLTSPQLISFELVSPSQSLFSPPVTPELKAEVSRLLLNYFNETPIYRFDDPDKALSNQVESVEIIADAIKIHF